MSLFEDHKQSPVVANTSVLVYTGCRFGVSKTSAGIKGPQASSCEAQLHTLSPQGARHEILQDG